METDFPELRAFAAANERMGDLFSWLDSQAGVTNVSWEMHGRKYAADSLMLSHFVEADISEGSGICYMVETSLRENGCVVEISVFMQESDGQTMMHEASFPVSGVGELHDVLLGAVEQLWRARETYLQQVIALSRER